MPPTKARAMKIKGQRSRAAQLRKSRAAKVSASPATPQPAVDPESSVCVTPTSFSSDQPEVRTSASKRKLVDYPLPKITSEETVSYALVDLTQLHSLFSSLLCPYCKTASVKFLHHQDDTFGLATQVELQCQACQQSVAKTMTSKRLETSRAFDVNRRTTLAFLNIGQGHSAIQSVCEVLGMKPLGESSHQEHVHQISCTAEHAKQKLIKDAVSTVREVYQSSNLAQPDEDGVLNIGVSYDGSWHKRGHTSKHGLGCVIDCVTGLVVDYESLSLYCQLCATTGESLKAKRQEYEAWMLKHKKDCAVNHEGSSGAMEVQAAKRLWERSLENKLRYNTIVSDGDCSSYRELLKSQPYGPSHPIEKEECINHFSKRVGTALRKVVATEKTRGVTLGGAKPGSLTQNKMASIQRYFKNAMLDNKRSLEGMRRAMWAVFLHATSTDSDPHHENCPTGPESWCQHNKAAALGVPPPPHKSSILLNGKVAEYIKPVFERLTSDELLGRCLQGVTQNANESFHSVVWGFCPKGNFVGAKRIKLALYMGAGQFNFGSISLAALMIETGLPVTANTLALGSQRDKERVRRAERAVSAVQRKRREVGRLAQIRAQEELEAAEGGPVYAAGAF